MLDRFRQGYFEKARHPGADGDSSVSGTLDSNAASVGIDLVDLGSERRRKKTMEEGLPYPLVETSLLKPTSFMNRSGHDTAEFLRDHKFRLRRNPDSDNKMDEMLVIYDDLDIPFGKITMKPKGNHGGNNGMRDIIKRIGHNRFPRLRIGIGSPDKRSAVEHVLSRFDAHEQSQLPMLLDFSCAVLRVYLHRGFPAASRLTNAPNADLNWFAEMRKKAVDMSRQAKW